VLLGVWHLFINFSQIDVIPNFVIFRREILTVLSRGFLDVILGIVEEIVESKGNCLLIL
jgi:hypothetical protein